MGGSCECGNEPLRSVKAKNLLSSQLAIVFITL
jgi:hypothetical protein